MEILQDRAAFVFGEKRAVIDTDLANVTLVPFLRVLERPPPGGGPSARSNGAMARGEDDAATVMVNPKVMAKSRAGRFMPAIVTNC